MEKFIAYVLQFGHLNTSQVDLIKSKATEIVIRKEDYYWEAGKIVRQIGFLTDGILRVFYHNPQGEEITRYFIEENHLILPGSLIHEDYAPSENLSAITDCKLIVFSRQDWRDILQA